MSNLEVTLSHFWQFAAHWKNGHRAKLNMTCEAGKLHLDFSANLDHPDLQHFTLPSTKKLSPSKLRRQEKRKEEMYSKETSASENDVNINIKHEENVIHTENISNMCVSNTPLPHPMPLSSFTSISTLQPLPSTSLPTLQPLSSTSQYFLPTSPPSSNLTIPNQTNILNKDPESNHVCQHCNFNHLPHPCVVSFPQKNNVPMQKCAKCHKYYNTENDLNDHIEREHYKCNIFYQDFFALKHHTNVITNCSPLKTFHHLI